MLIIAITDQLKTTVFAMTENPNSAPADTAENIPDSKTNFTKVFAEEQKYIKQRKVAYPFPKRGSEPKKSKAQKIENEEDEGREKVEQKIEDRTKTRGDGLPNFEALNDGEDKEKPSEFLSNVLDEIRTKEQNEAWGNYDRHNGLVGLALSGGGIRSSTFNLGILQALNRVGLFRAIDYLSTVSGGGYIGSCLSSVFSGLEETEHFPFKHSKNKQESPVFRHLRNNAEYLAPGGFLDYLKIPALLFRGIIINLSVVLIPLLLLASLAYLVIPLNLSLPWSNHFSFTIAVFAVYLIMVMAYPLASHIYYRNKPKENSDAWRMRDIHDKVLGLIIGTTLLVAFVELQPILIAGIMDLRDDSSHVLEWILGIWGGSTGIGLLSSSALAGRLQSLREKVFAYTVSCSGLLLLWAGFLYLSVLAIEGKTVLSLPLPFWYLLVGLILWIYHYLYLNINYTSLHNFYRDRLSKAFIVKLAPKSKNDKSSEDSKKSKVVPADTIKLSELNVPYKPEKPGTPKETAQTEDFGDIINNQAPYHIINAALNTNKAPEDYKRGRNSDFFIFSKLYTGSNWTGYCETKKMEKRDRRLRLATAMAISGAAASPHMGRLTNKRLAVLLTMLNIRLNYWLINPNWVKEDKPLPKKFFRRIGPGSLIREMFGIMNYKSALVNLSDGGHLENLGVIQLLRRQCRLIIVGDGERDPNFQFQGLSEVIRMAMVDEGIKIEMEGLDDIREGEKAHAVGTIYYDSGQTIRDDNGKVQAKYSPRIGKLIYLKLSLCGDYNLKATLDSQEFLSSALRSDNGNYDSGPYLMHYKARNPDFPHQSTGDQFFDEQQFEAYRALGVKVGLDALAH